MHTAGQFVRNAACNAVRLVCALLSGLVITAIVARYLGASGMGAYTYALWLVSILVFAGNLGVPTTATRYIAERLGAGDMDQVGAVTTRLLVTQFHAALVVCAVGLIFLLHVLPGIIGPVVLAVLVVTQLIQQAFIGVLLGMQRYASAAAISAVDVTTKIAFMAVAVCLNRGLEGLYSAMLASSALSMLAAIRCLKVGRWNMAQRPSINLRPDLGYKMRRFSIAAAYSLALNAIVWQRSEIFFLKRLADFHQVGLYAVAFAIAASLRAIPGVISETLLPVASELQGRNPIQLAELYRRSVRAVLMIMSPLSLFGIISARYLVDLFYGSQFAGAVAILQLLLASTLVTCVGGVGWAVMYAAERQKFDVIAGTFIAVLDIGLAISMIPRLGAMGAAIANSAAQLTAILVTLVYLGRYMGLELPYRDMFRIIAAALLAASPAACFLLSSWPPYALAAGVAVGTIVYPALLRRFGVTGPHDLATLWHLAWNRAGTAHAAGACSSN